MSTYTLPTMRQIDATPWNGFRMASTFSGCGGSCLGWKMAGFAVKWANEFVPVAADCYQKNFRGTALDRRDIRIIQPDQILNELGMEPGELDVLEGSPPCASFSTAGLRSKGWGKEKSYSGTIQRTDDLFPEFARLVRGVRPKVFVAENVSGMVKGVSKGTFKKVLAELSKGYRVACQLVDASWLGVPQKRVRLIFVGVRNDLGLPPAFPRPRPDAVTLRDAIAPLSFGEPEPECWMKDGSALRREWDRVPAGGQSRKYFQLVKPYALMPCPTLTALGGNRGMASVCHPSEPRKFSIAEMKRLFSFPADFELVGTYMEQYERLGRSVPPLMMRAIAEAVRDEVLKKALQCKPS